MKKLGSSLKVYSNLQNDTIDILYNKNNIRLSDFYEYSGGKEYTFSSDKYVYIVKLVKRQIEIYRFDTEGNEINKTEPIDALNSKDIKVLTITKFGANYIVLYIKNNESGDNARRFNSLHYRQIDLETGDIGEEQLLDKMKVRSYDRYEFCFSVDNSFLMVYYYMNNESTSSKRVKCIIYQDDFEIFETEEIQIPYDELNESIEHVFVTNYATPYWVIKNEEKKEHKFFILKLSSQTAEEYKPEELAKWGSLYTYFNTKDQVDLVGTYDKGKQIFVQNLKKRSDLTVVNLPLNIYPNTVTNQHFRELLLLEAKPCKDEGRLIVTQEHCKKVVRERGGADGMQYYDRIKEYLRNMILVRLDKDKKIKWIANIP